ncbi:hypothetical protein LNP74_26420 [Klebsiella pneumoniae subsp. pneumoniae]|nr:hypothetical protein [Klebsiella pneumoniae subsp. pneumoniae]
MDYTVGVASPISSPSVGLISEAPSGSMATTPGQVWIMQVGVSIPIVRHPQA